MHQFAELLEAKICLPLRHKRADRYARRSLKGSLRNRLGYAPAFPQLHEMIAARSGGIANPARIQDGLPDRFFIADHLTLVQNTQEDVWRNLKDFPLGTPVHA